MRWPELARRWTSATYIGGWARRWRCKGRRAVAVGHGGAGKTRRGGCVGAGRETWEAPLVAPVAGDGGLPWVRPEPRRAVTVWRPHDLSIPGGTSWPGFSEEMRGVDRVRGGARFFLILAHPSY